MYSPTQTRTLTPCSGVEGAGREEMRMLHVPDAEALLSFPRSKWGIPEPTDEQAAAMEDGLLTAAIDTVIVTGGPSLSRPSAVTTADVVVGRHHCR